MSASIEQIRSGVPPCEEYPEDSSYNCIDHPTVLGLVCWPCKIRTLVDLAEAAQAEAEVWVHVKSFEFGMREGHDVFELIDAQQATREALGKIPQDHSE